SLILSTQRSPNGQNRTFSTGAFFLQSEQASPLSYICASNVTRDLIATPPTVSGAELKRTIAPQPMTFEPNDSTSATVSSIACPLRIMSSTIMQGLTSPLLTYCRNMRLPFSCSAQ